MGLGVGGGWSEGPGGVWGGALFTDVAPPLRAAHASPRPLPPGPRRLNLPPPPALPSQDGDTALDDAKSRGNPEVVKLLENDPAYLAAQAGRAAPHAAPSYTLRIPLVHAPYA